MKIKLIISLLIIILLSQGVIAIGVVPASKEVILSDNPTSYNVRILNNEGNEKTINLEITGELSEYITINKQRINFKEGQTQEDVTITINKMPEHIKPGEYTSRLLIKNSNNNQGENIALVGVSSRILMTIPGEGVNLDATIFTPNFINGKTNTFSVEVTNKGNSDAEECTAILNIYTSMNSEVASLISEKTRIKAKSTNRIQIPWTPQVYSGNYLAKAKITCKSTEITTEQTFHVGSPNIKINNIYADNFNLGSLSLFKLIATSEWGEEIKNVFVEVELEDKGKIIDSYKTHSKDFKPKDTEIYDVFLNTKSIQPGKYNLFVKINYLGKESETVYEAQLFQNRAILTSATGQIIGSAGIENNEESHFKSILILSILTVVILNIFLATKVIRRNKNKKKIKK
jgi:hypothetical protein